MLWNKDKTESVRASKIRNFTINHRFGLAGGYLGGIRDASSPPYYALEGWYNSNENFYLGEFELRVDAEKFLEEIHAKIEGRASDEVTKELYAALAAILLNNEIGEYESQHRGLPRMIEVRDMARAALTKVDGRIR